MPVQKITMWLLLLLPFLSAQRLCSYHLAAQVCLESKVGEDSSLVYALNGVFVNTSTMQPVEGVEVVVTNRKNGRFSIQYTGKSGGFYFELHDEAVYTLLGSKPYFFDSKQVSISTIGRQTGEQISMEMPIEQIELLKVYQMEGMAFAPNEAGLMPESVMPLRRLKTLMQRHPDMTVEIAVHTDARGNDAHNLRLSLLRATAIAAQLQALGIQPKRFSVKGYGEQELTNGCANGVRCSSDKHAENRRVEFKIIKI
jgi:outer membrane protein OmpA-like peptidoglycan-associated protein